MKIIIQFGLNGTMKADAKCCKNLLELIHDKSNYFLITTGDFEGPIKISGIAGYSFKNIKINPLFKKIFSVLLFPDINYLLIRKIVKFIYDKFKFDTLYCFSGDYVTQIIGTRLKAKSKTDVKIKSIFYDPVPSLNFVYKNKLNILCSKKRMEKIIKKYVDYIYCTEGLFDYYKDHFSNVVMCGLPLYVKRLPIVSQQSSNINFLYVGSINTKVRNVEPLVNFFVEFGKLQKYNLTFVGNFDKKVKKKLIAINPLFYPYCHKDELIKIYERSDVLVLLGNNNTYQTPSKLIEYLSFNKKIISFESVKGSQSQILLEKYKNSFIINNEFKLYDFISFLKKKNVEQGELEKILFIHTARYNYELIFN